LGAKSERGKGKRKTFSKGNQGGGGASFVPQGKGGGEISEKNKGTGMVRGVTLE